MAKIQVYQDLNESGKIMVQGLGAFMPLDKFEAMRIERDAHKANTALIAEINEYCQKNNIGEWGRSASVALMNHVQALRLERNALNETIQNLIDFCAKNPTENASNIVVWLEEQLHD
jgi:hypothetical protein